MKIRSKAAYLRPGLAAMAIMLTAACGLSDGGSTPGDPSSSAPGGPGVLVPGGEGTPVASAASSEPPGPATSTPDFGPVAPPPAGWSQLLIMTQIGEQCPHIPRTPDPRCDPQPRPQTSFEVRAGDGGLVTTGRSDSAGRAIVQVRPGTYVIRGEPVAEYQFTPERRVEVSADASVTVPLTYTTGIQ